MYLCVSSVNMCFLCTYILFLVNIFRSFVHCAASNLLCRTSFYISVIGKEQR